MKNTNSLLTTYHTRKVRAVLCVVGVCGIAPVAFAFSSASNACMYGNAAALVALLGMLWLGYVVACPKCNLRILFHAMSSQSVGNWLHWSVHVVECPRCHHVAEKKTMSSNTLNCTST